MDGECAFCGRTMASDAHVVFCDDCQLTHAACPACATELTQQAEGYRLVA